MAITVGLTERTWYRKIRRLIMFPFNVAIAGGEIFAHFPSQKCRQLHPTFILQMTETSKVYMECDMPTFGLVCQNPLVHHHVLYSKYYFRGQFPFSRTFTHGYININRYHKPPIIPFLIPRKRHAQPPFHSKSQLITASNFLFQAQCEV